MGVVYLISVWLHILAATTWLGGMIFLVLVVVPTLRRGERALAAAVMRDSGRRFRTVGWTCFAVLIVTGSFNAWWRGVRLHMLFDPSWTATTFGRALILKLSAFLVVLALSVRHDFFVGPRASRALLAGDTPAAERMRREAARLGRATAALALVLYALAVVLVRGAVW
jgi:putative copper export protein